MSNQTIAMVFALSSSRLLVDVAICIDFCRRNRYQMGGVVQDDWRKACEYLWRGEADVLVVADERSLNPNRAPRVEVVAHQQVKPKRPDVPTGRRGSDGRSDGPPLAPGERSHMIKRSEEE